MLFSVLSAMRWVDLNVLICFVIIVVSLIWIILFSPVYDRNKPLDNTECRVYCNRAIIIAGVEAAIACASVMVGLVHLARCISWCFIVATVMMGMGLVKNHLSCNHECK